MIKISSDDFYGRPEDTMVVTTYPDDQIAMRINQTTMLWPRFMADAWIMSDLFRPPCSQRTE